MSGAALSNDISRVRIGDLWLDVGSRRLWSAEGGRIALSEGEMDMLIVLTAWRGRPLSRNELRLATRGRPSGPCDRSVDVMVMRLRRKLGSSADVLSTVAGAGYLLRHPELETMGD